MPQLATDVAYSCNELAKMKLPGFPVSRQGWDVLVKRDGWGFREIKSKGRGGIRREYAPPPEVMTLIEQHQHGKVGKSDVRGGYVTDQKASVNKHFAEEPSNPWKSPQPVMGGAETAGAELAQTLRQIEKNKDVRYINVTLLAHCLDAVDEIAARKGLKPLTTAHRLSVAICAYRQLTEQVLPEPLDFLEFSRLGKEEFAAAATLAIWSTDVAGGEEGDGFVIATF